MKEMIYRKDAIDAMYKIVERNLDSSVFEDDLSENPHIDVIVDELENLPSAEPEPRWISVTDKLPEKDGKYLVWAVMSYTPDHVDEPCECQQIDIASFLSGKYGSDFLWK